MDPYYLNFVTGPQAYTIDPFQSTDQDVHLPSLSYNLPIAAAQSYQPYQLLDHDSRGLSTSPHIARTCSAPSLRPSVGSRPTRAPSQSGHPYHHPRPRHNADRPYVQHQGWSQPSFTAIPAPIPASGTPGSYNAVTSSLTSISCHDADKLRLSAKKSHAAPALGLAMQTNTAPATDQFVSTSMVDGFTVPGQAPPPPPPRRKTPPHTPVDPRDVEFARYHYGNKRCFYRCRFDLSGSPCNKWIIGERTQVLRHLRNYHHLQTGPAAPARCLWDQCTHSRLMKQENLSRHVVMHLGVKWKCPHCDHLFSRDDAVHRHMERVLPGADVTEAEVVPSHEARGVADVQPKTAFFA